MSSALKVVLIASLLLAAFLAALVWAFFRHPLAFNAARERLLLRASGLRRQTITTSVGNLTAWVGGQGPTVVLLHGAGDQAGTWAAVAPALRPHFRLLLLDLPGHGASQPREGPLPMDVVFRGTREAVAELVGNRPVWIVGNSLGAWLACLLAAERNLPVQGVILVNGGPIKGQYLGPTLAPENREQARRVMEVLMGPAGARVPGFVLDDVVRAGRKGPIARLLVALASWEPLVWGPSEMGKLAVPVRLVWGEEDRLFDRAYAEKMLAAFPDARAHFLAGCGHIPQRQCPRALAEALLAVLPH